MLQYEFARFIINATDETIKEFLPDKVQEVQAEIKALFKREYKGEGDLTRPEVFNYYSYCQFKVVAKHLKSEASRLEFTRRIGKRIYDKIKGEKVIEVSGDPDDVKGVETALKIVNDYFRKTGYVKESYVKWDTFDEETWRKTGKANFVYVMRDPVILPSAQRLFREEGFAQHFSSRTLENLLEEFNIEGREVKEFDPTKAKEGYVVEVWELKKRSRTETR